MRDVTDETFSQLLELSKTVPFLLDMWAPWCAPCRQLGPILEKAVQQAGGRVALAKVNVDESPAIGQAFRVQSIPAVFLLMNGQPAPLFNGRLARFVRAGSHQQGHRVGAKGRCHGSR
ncbi:thioredoxin family protein [Mobiluncus holmesii]|uniref:thioredoxin family protein n=1 Tax=Mobiluncus holmesii TaxID=144178 RepID=UPI0021CBCF40|nr:thioredoxin domain-containing protein [Mobiluncus holmesii]